MKQRKTFLTWALFNAIAVSVLTALGIAGFTHGVSGDPAIVSVIILAVGVVVSGYAGWLCWRADTADCEQFGISPDDAQDILHGGNHVHHAIWLCQVLGLIGALMGYRQETQVAASSTDVTSAIHSVFAGLGNGLTATLMGILISLLFFAESRLLEQKLYPKLGLRG